MNIVTDCDIITAEEAMELYDNITDIGTTWAVRDDEEASGCIWFMMNEFVVDGQAIRPCLRMDDCDLKIGDTIDWFGLTWLHIGKGIWLCEYAIAYGYIKGEDYDQLHKWLNQWYAERVNKGDKEV